MPRQTRIDTRKLKKLIQEMPGRVDEAAAKAAAQVTAEIVASFNTSPAGREYQLYNPRRSHTASVRRKPPNVDTGTLRASIRWFKLAQMLYRVEDGVEYGAWLEFGTMKNGGYMAARPFFSPVFFRWQKRKLLRLLKNEGLFKV